MIFYLRYFLYNNQVIKPTKKKDSYIKYKRNIKFYGIYIFYIGRYFITDIC